MAESYSITPCRSIEWILVIAQSDNPIRLLIKEQESPAMNSHSILPFVENQTFQNLQSHAGLRSAFNNPYALLDGIC